MQNKYDIFISYRRQDGKQYAKILQLELEKRGYKVFLDYDELVDGVFGDDIREAISSAPVFMMVLTPLYLERSMMDDSWVREEIRLAVQQNKHIIPVNPDKAFNGIPSGTPPEIASLVKTIQHSDINFGELFRESMNKMEADRIRSIVPKPRKMSFLRTGIVIIVIAILIGGGFIARRAYVNSLKMESTPWGVDFRYSRKLSPRQIRALNSIINGMVSVPGSRYTMGVRPQLDSSFDSHPDLESEVRDVEISDFCLGKYEVSVHEWFSVMGGSYKKADSNLPVDNVSYEDCEGFIARLNSMSNLEFRLPSEEEWEYAARGGAMRKNCIFSCGNDPDSVAWYLSNSGGMAHPTRESNRLYCTNPLDLRDMSGNVSEICGTVFEEGSHVVRGGNFMSEPYQLTVTHREPIPDNTGYKGIGLRLAL